MSPVIVTTAITFENGWTVNASEYVIWPACSPPTWLLAVSSARIPPGFMNATTAAPLLAGLVDSSWASAITSPSADSPDGAVARVMSAVIEPTTLFACAAERFLYLLIRVVWAASAATSFVLIWLSADFDTTLPVVLSMPRLIFVIIRPNELALVTSLPLIVQL